MRIDNALVKALALAHRWKEMLDDAPCGTVPELAVGEKLERRYLRQILVLTLLPLDIGEAILGGQPHAELGVHVLHEGFPLK